jgi:hypothetical protein
LRFRLIIPKKKGGTAQAAEKRRVAPVSSLGLAREKTPKLLPAGSKEEAVPQALTAWGPHPTSQLRNALLSVQPTLAQTPPPASSVRKCEDLITF